MREYMISDVRDVHGVRCDHRDDHDDHGAHDARGVRGAHDGHDGHDVRDVRGWSPDCSIRYCSSPGCSSCCGGHDGANCVHRIGRRSVPLLIYL